MKFKYYKDGIQQEDIKLPKIYVDRMMSTYRKVATRWTYKTGTFLGFDNIDKRSWEICFGTREIRLTTK